MTSKSVLVAVIEHALSQEPCASCQVADDWRERWPVKLPELFKCDVDESYPCCPWTMREFPWKRTAMYMFVDYDKEVRDD